SVRITVVQRRQFQQIDFEEFRVMSHTRADLRAAWMNCLKTKGREAANAVLASFNVSNLSEIADADIPAAILALGNTKDPKKGRRREAAAMDDLPEDEKEALAEIGRRVWPKWNAAGRRGDVS